MRLHEIIQNPSNINESLLESFVQSEQNEQFKTVNLEELMEAVDVITKG